VAGRLQDQLNSAEGLQGFNVGVVRSGKPQWVASPVETLAFSGAVPAYLQAA